MLEAASVIRSNGLPFQGKAMNPADFLSRETFWREDSFRIIRPEEWETLGIHPSDIPLGTFAARKHPSQLQSRFGGNAYGFGVFEIYDRLNSRDMKLLQQVSFGDPEHIRRYYRQINEIYKKIGLLIRFSGGGKPYYLIPAHLVSTSLTHIQAKVDEITKIIGFHRKKYLKEYHQVGLVTHEDDLVIRELSFRFKEHRFITLDSLVKMRDLNQILDLVVIPKDLYEMILMERFAPVSEGMLSRSRFNQYAMYVLWKLYNLLKPGGEIFIIANHHAPKSNETREVVFKGVQEKRNFALFTHMFKTRKKYRLPGRSLRVNVFDFQKYLSGLYVEQEILDRLLGGRQLQDMTLDQVSKLPYLDFPLTEGPFFADQERMWSKPLSVFFEEIFLKPLLPAYVEADWKKRFTLSPPAPRYMIIYLGQKKPLATALSTVKREVTESGLMGCPPELRADYRDSFEYVIRVLRVLEEIKKGNYQGVSRTYTDRLKEPFENKSRRFPPLNDVIKLLSKIGRLEKMKDYLNPDGVEGPETKMVQNLEALPLFGFSHKELKEVQLIVLGHTSLGRVLSGKMNEKSLRPLTDLARSYDQNQALNLLRYCRLMTVAEMEAAKGSKLTPEEISELFDLYDSAVSVVTSRDLDWERLLDEKITSMGGIHYKIIRKLLKMTNHYDFLNNWAELRQKGQMEKESLTDYDVKKLARVENVIRLVESVEQFEDMFLRSDPVQLPAFYRKFLNMEFNGTARLLEKMDARLVFVLLWIAVNVAKGEIINFNPVLADLNGEKMDERVKKLEQEVRAINIRHLDLQRLRQLSEQLYRNGSSFILGTGFHITADPATQGLEVACMDMDESTGELEALLNRAAGRLLREMPLEELVKLETLFGNLESFYQSHLRLPDATVPSLRLPARQMQWFEKAQNLRKQLRINLLEVLFRPENIFTDLDLLCRYAPSFLHFVLPEFRDLQNSGLCWHLYLDCPVTQYVRNAARKLQALIRREKENFQDVRFLHRLAQREFGPLATGTVGVNESQIEELEKIAEKLSRNEALFNALTKTILFHPLGSDQALREKHKRRVSPVDFGQAAGLFVEKERIAERHQIGQKEESFLLFLVRHHRLIHHILRGEISFYAIEEVLQTRDKEVFDAFFLFSFVMLSAIREDLIIEDMAERLFQIRELCHRIMGGRTTLDRELSQIFLRNGELYWALEAFQRLGLPKGTPPSRYLDSGRWEKPETMKCVQSGKMIFALERLFRLRGIRFVAFPDLVNLMLGLPLEYIYKKRKFTSIGYPTFEKRIYESSRVYNTLRGLREEIRHFILNTMVEDRVRIFGYEEVSGFLSYENQIKLLLAALLGSTRMEGKGGPININFLAMGEEIEKRYEAVNASLNRLSADDIWSGRDFFRARTGVIMKRAAFPKVLTVYFQDPVNISGKIARMGTMNGVKQLKRFFHDTLQTLRKHPFYTDDYQTEFEKAFEKRLSEIADMILVQTKKKMDLIKDFRELDKIMRDLLKRSLEIGFSEEQKHRLNDLYELRKDSLKREKLAEIEGTLDTIQDASELQGYWERIKWDLQSNRPFFGKEFENLIARKFDATAGRLQRQPRTAHGAKL